jgi:hypothetical protein
VAIADASVNYTLLPFHIDEAMSLEAAAKAAGESVPSDA